MQTIIKAHVQFLKRRCKHSHLWGHLIHDVLKGVLDVEHGKFGIQDKIVMTVTDNRANFVQAFDTHSQLNDADTDHTD